MICVDCDEEIIDYCSACGAPIKRVNVVEEIANLTDRVQALEMMHKAIVEALVRKAASETAKADLAIWWEARLAYMTGQPEESDSIIDDWADFALKAYKTKAAQLLKEASDGSEAKPVR